MLNLQSDTVERLLPIADLFGWVPELLDWLGGVFSWVPDVIEWIGREFDWVWSAIAWAGSAIALAATWVAGGIQWIWTADFPVSDEIRAGFVVAAGIVAITFLIRHVRLRRLARVPRVQITEFTWTGEQKQDRDGLWVTSLFREQLSMLQTDPLDPLPERSPSAPLVDIVEGVSQSVTQKADFGKMAGRLYRAVWPVAAYEVWGTLRPLAGNQYRISVQLVDRTRGNRTLVSEAFAGKAWNREARRAAMAVAGGLYPEIAVQYRGPWAEWRNPVPADLLGHYHEAQEHETENQLAQAMGAYHEALKEDPLNPGIRLKIAMLQERLVLDLDAWVTYLGIVDEVNDNAWRDPQRHTRLIAAYRLAILLGNGRIRHQWMKVDDGQNSTLRDKVRSKHRSDLVTALENDPLLTGRPPAKTRWRNRIATAPAARLLDSLLHCDYRQFTRAGARKDARREWIGKVFPDPVERNCETAADMEAVLKLMSLRRLEDLDAWLRIRPPSWPHQWASWRQRRPRFGSWFSRRGLSRSSVRVSKRLARIQIAREFKAHAERTCKTVDIYLDVSPLISPWPFPVAGPDPLRHLVRWLAPRRRLANGRDDSWQLHYNAACLIAVTLPPDATPPGERREELVEALIDELEEYAHRAGTERVAAQADWVAFDDPDLIPLEGDQAFKRWASHHIPRELPKQRPERSVDVERFTGRMIYQAACEFAHVWQLRACGAPGTAEILAWWQEEQAAWLRLWVVCREKGSWQQRLAGLDALERWRRSHGLAEMGLGHESRDQAVAAEPLKPGLFQAIEEQIGAREEPVAATADENSLQDAANAAILGWLQNRVEVCTATHESKESCNSPLPLRKSERKEALRAARLWKRLAEALEAELRERPVIGSRQTREELLDKIRESLPEGFGGSPSYTARWPNFSRMRP